MANYYRHFCLVTHHRWLVFCFSIKAGIPWRGFVHDLSKFTPEEFIESATYYQGNTSPINACKKANGYSRAWLHHKGRNKHHYEYWIDLTAPEKSPMPPYPYAAEMVCDHLAATKVYAGKAWTPQDPLAKWDVLDKPYMNQRLHGFLYEAFEHISQAGIKQTINPAYLKALYQKHCKETR